jgi:hypothetical protein
MSPFRTLSMLAMLSLSAACAQAPKPTPVPPTPTVAIDAKPDACKVFKKIVFSRLHDTVETIGAVKEHNAALEAYCGPKP